MDQLRDVVVRIAADVRRLGKKRLEGSVPKIATVDLGIISDHLHPHPMLSAP